jgi:hypothetical protein
LDHSDTVSVVVSGSAGNGSTGTMTLNYQKPQIMLYEKSPSLGLRLGRLLNDGFTMGEGEMTISAEPFYFSKNQNNIIGTNMDYKWTVNSSAVTPPGKKNELTLRGSATPGTATASVGITNISTLFQEAKQAVKITLGK